MNDQPVYWFRAKRYGWGWGLPGAWQGWVVYALYAGILLAGGRWFSPQLRPVAFALNVMISTSLLVLICWLKGEPPRWRWGSR